MAVRFLQRPARAYPGSVYRWLGDGKNRSLRESFGLSLWAAAAHRLLERSPIPSPPLSTLPRRRSAFVGRALAPARALAERSPCLHRGQRPPRVMPTAPSHASRRPGFCEAGDRFAAGLASGMPCAPLGEEILQQRTDAMSATYLLPSRVVWLCSAFVAAEGGALAANFEVHGAASDRAALIAARAEEALERISSRLSGEQRGTTWAVRCQIHLHRSPGSFARAVGGPPGGARGATSIEFEGDSVALRRIDVMDDDPGTVPAALAHEIVHVALADRFPVAPPPRWADEGLAVLFDDTVTQRGHEADFHEARRAGMTWSVAHLMAMHDYPREGHRQRVFYGQSAAFVRWLLARRDAATFLAFLDDAATIGDSAAIERHYGFKSLAALERAWNANPTLVDGASDESHAPIHLRR